MAIFDESFAQMTLSTRFTVDKTDQYLSDQIDHFLKITKCIQINIDHNKHRFATKNNFTIK